MARQPTRTRRVLLVATLALLAVVVVAWGLSFLQPLEVFYTNAAFREPESGNERSDVWQYAGWTVYVSNNYGSLEISYSKFDRSGPTREETIKYCELPGWRLEDTFWHDAWPNWLDFTQSPEYSETWPGWINMSALGHRFWREWASKNGTASLTIPHFTLAFIFGGVAFWLWRPIRRWSKRLANNQCPRCGYDRKGLAADATCPECGESSAPEPPPT